MGDMVDQTWAESEEASFDYEALPGWELRRRSEPRPDGDLSGFVSYREYTYIEREVLPATPLTVQVAVAMELLWVFGALEPLSAPDRLAVYRERVPVAEALVAAWDQKAAESLRREIWREVRRMPSFPMATEGGESLMMFLLGVADAVSGKGRTTNQALVTAHEVSTRIRVTVLPLMKKAYLADPALDAAGLRELFSPARTLVDEAVPLYAKVHYGLDLPPGRCAAGQPALPPLRLN
ncbi:MAG: hypothetical protein Q4G45_14130 [Actinomycetia bacterium]|nr:hypothetical protein [Actinomycetes bacterium]